MATRIVIEVPTRLDHALDGMTVRDIELLLMDALYEFTAHRASGNGREYVDKRYPGDSVYAGERREWKIQQVEQRCRAADAIHSGRVKLLEVGMEAGDE